MPRLFTPSLAVVLLAGFVSGCGFSDTEVREYSVALDRVVIVDRTGAEWDITTAVHTWGMESDRFDHGLGADAIEPLVNPRLLVPGDQGYPDDNQTFAVIATEIAGDARAYGRLDITRHEVVDETIGDAPVAVAY